MTIKNLKNVLLENVNNENQTLTLMVGIPGSGKSHTAKQLAAAAGNTVILSSDTIREELFGSASEQKDGGKVFQLLTKRMREALEEGKNVIVDSTNVSFRSRREILSAVPKAVSPKLRAVLLTPTFETCKKRDEERERRVGEDVIWKFIKQFQIPTEAEGFSEIIWDGGDGVTSILAITQKMEGFDQESSHHREDLLTHASLVRDLYGGSHPKEIEIALLHDVGKLFTKTYKAPGEAVYYNHAEVGAYYLLSHRLEDKLYSPEEMIQTVIPLVNFHMLPFNWAAGEEPRNVKSEVPANIVKKLKEFNTYDKLASFPTAEVG